MLPVPLPVLKKLARRTDAKTTGHGITRNFNNFKLLLLLLQVVDIIHKVAVTSQGIYCFELQYDRSC